MPPMIAVGASLFLALRLVPLFPVGHLALAGAVHGALAARADLELAAAGRVPLPLPARGPAALDVGSPGRLLVVDFLNRVTGHPPGQLLLPAQPHQGSLQEHKFRPTIPMDDKG